VEIRELLLYSSKVILIIIQSNKLKKWLPFKNQLVVAPFLVIQIISRVNNFIINYIYKVKIHDISIVDFNGGDEGNLRYSSRFLYFFIYTSIFKLLNIIFIYNFGIFLFYKINCGTVVVYLDSNIYSNKISFMIIFLISMYDAPCFF
jgi:hypothetical protein